MKISVNGVDLFELSGIKKQVICNDVCAEDLDEDLKRRLNYILMHKYEQCFKRLKAEWDSKLAANGVVMIPTDPDAYASLVFSQPNYKDRSARELEAKSLRI
jgi:hypothetical protein